jgi:hypothetical protein
MYFREINTYSELKLRKYASYIYIYVYIYVDRGFMWKAVIYFKNIFKSHMNKDTNDFNQDVLL